jgi:hypothetical protein
MGLGSIRVDELLDYVRLSVIALPAANSG